MQKLSAVHLPSWRDTSRPDANRVLHLSKRGRKSTPSSESHHLPAKLPSQEDGTENSANRANRSASRPRSWLPSLKHQRYELPAAAPTPTPTPGPGPGPGPLADGCGGRQSLELPARRIANMNSNYIPHYSATLPSTDGLTRDREWVDSVRILIQETEDAFQAVRDVLEFNTRDDAASRTCQTCKTWSSPEHVHSETRLAAAPTSVPSGGVVSASLKDQTRQPQTARKVNKPQRKETLGRASSMFKGFSKIKTPTSWVDQLLTGARLKRIEADEMITREQIRQFCEGRRLRAQQEREMEQEQETEHKMDTLERRAVLEDEEGRQSSSSDSTESASSGTSRGSSSTSGSSMGLSSDHASLCSAGVVVAMDPIDHAVVCRDFSVPRQEEARRDDVLASAMEQQQYHQSPQSQQHARHPKHGTPTAAEVQLPDPPPRNPERINKRSHRLPTIPEAESDPPESRGEVSSASLDDRPGVPFPRTSGGKGTQDAAAPARQQDGHGDDDNAPVYDHEDDGTADEMADWFDTFGFESHGQLIHVDENVGDVVHVPARDSGGVDSNSPPPGLDARDEPTAAASPFSAPIRFWTSPGPPRVWTPRAQTPVVYSLRDSSRWHGYRV
ncbi:hypothetical protein E4U21_000453 [Claviceps maximensis]|nr:hypothetical protein E4U21_000453 [Claviceps maximensis]